MRSGTLPRPVDTGPGMVTAKITHAVRTAFTAVTPPNRLVLYNPVEDQSQASATSAAGVPNRRAAAPAGEPTTRRTRGLSTTYASTTPTSISPARLWVPKYAPPSFPERPAVYQAAAKLAAASRAKPPPAARQRARVSFMSPMKINGRTTVSCTSIDRVHKCWTGEGSVSTRAKPAPSSTYRQLRTCPSAARTSPRYPGPAPTRRVTCSATTAATVRKSGGRMRRARCSQNRPSERRPFCAHSARQMVATRKPDRVKKLDRPRKPPRARSNPWWNASTASSATARRPSNAATCGSSGRGPGSPRAPGVERSAVVAGRFCGPVVLDPSGGSSGRRRRPSPEAATASGSARRRTLRGVGPSGPYRSRRARRVAPGGRARGTGAASVLSGGPASMSGSAPGGAGSSSSGGGHAEPRAVGRGPGSGRGHEVGYARRAAAAPGAGRERLVGSAGDRQPAARSGRPGRRPSGRRGGSAACGRRPDQLRPSRPRPRLGRRGVVPVGQVGAGPRAGRRAAVVAARRRRLSAGRVPRVVAGVSLRARLRSGVAAGRSHGPGGGRDARAPGVASGSAGRHRTRATAGRCGDDRRPPRRGGRTGRRARAAPRRGPRRCPRPRGSRTVAPVAPARGGPAHAHAGPRRAPPPLRRSGRAGVVARGSASVLHVRAGCQRRGSGASSQQGTPSSVEQHYPPRRSACPSVPDSARSRTVRGPIGGRGRWPPPVL